MKTVMAWGGVLLVLCVGGRLWRRAQRRTMDYRAVSSIQPLPPSTYTYKEMTYSLN
jgi:hypothetical protein